MQCGAATVITMALLIDVGTIVEWEEGSTQFNRKKFMTISENRLQEWKAPNSNKGGTAENADYIYKELDLYLGRHLGVCNAITRKFKGNEGEIEDPDRPGFAKADVYNLLDDSFKTDDEVPQEMRDHFGDNLDYIFHEQPANPRMYPAFMGLGGSGGDDDCKAYPKRHGCGTYEHCGEFALNCMKHYFNDFTWPRYYECMNEPTWAHLPHEDFADFHVGLYEYFRANGVDKEKMMIGGPCSWGTLIYKETFANKKMWKNYKGFYQKAFPTLDFYSFHMYDHPGRMLTGPSRSLDCILDTHENVVLNIAGSYRPYATSEYGGHIEDEIMNEKNDLNLRYKGLYYHMRSAGRMMITLAKRPYNVAKAVPYMKPVTDWHPEHFSTIWEREGFERKAPLRKGALFTYLEMWRDFRGHYVDIPDEGRFPDLLIMALVDTSDEPTLRVVVCNLSDDQENEFFFDLPEGVSASSREIRRLYKNDDEHMARDEAEAEVSEEGQTYAMTLIPGEIQYQILKLENYEQNKTFKVNRSYGAKTERRSDDDGVAEIKIEIPEEALEGAERAQLRISWGAGPDVNPTPEEVSVNETSLPWVDGEQRTAEMTENAHVRFRLYNLDAGILGTDNVVRVKFEGPGAILTAANIFTFVPA